MRRTAVHRRRAYGGASRPSYKTAPVTLGSPARLRAPLVACAISALLALTVGFSLAGSATRAFAEPRTVRVGLYENEPKVFTDPNGHPAGIFVDLLEEIAADEGWELVWTPRTWDEDLKALEEGRIDLMPDVAYSAERDMKYDFHSTPVVDSWSYVYAAPGVEVDRFSQLNGKRVAVLRHSIQQTEFEQMAEGFGFDIEIVEAPSLAKAFEMASQGEVDAAVANHLFGDYFYQDWGLRKTPIVFNAVPLFYATAEGKNHDLLDAIDTHLEKWIDEPGSAYYQILDSYTTKDKPGVIPQWVIWAASIGAAALLLAIGLVALLRWQVAVKTRNLQVANESLERAEETLRLAVEAAREGIFDWYPKTGEITWTDRCYEMLGYEPNEFRMDFDAWTTLLHPDDAERVWESLARIDEGDHTFELESRLKAKSGDWVWVASRGKSVIVDSQGKAERVIGTNIDISDRKRAEEEVLRLNAELEARVEERTARLAMANKDLESFSYSVSHDLRAPLRAISGFAQIVARRHRDGLNEEGRHYIDNIVEASERMGHLIEDLLTYSRLGRKAVHSEPVSLQQLAERLASDASSRVEDAGGSLQVADDLPTIQGDETLLTQILTNLLDNAVTYRRPGVAPKLKLDWQDEAEDVVITVADNGIGIPAEYQDKVFNIFQRLHSEDEYPGTGIGLANVKKCVDMLHGTVWLESVEGEGTTFFVRLPKER